MINIFPALRKQREAAWREYKRTQDIDALLTKLETIQAIVKVLRDANETETERIRGIRNAYAA